MNIFALEIWDNEASLCTFYTVRKDGAKNNETDKFFIKYDAEPKFTDDAEVLNTFLLDSIGEQHGAIDDFFNRHENQVKGLPPTGKVRIEGITYLFPDFSLRLYALKINEEIVILFNGGIKDEADNQHSSLHLNWVEACSFAKRIEEAFRDGIIIINHENRTITLEDGSDEIYL